MGKYKLLCDKDEVAKKLSAWAKSPEGKKRIKEDNKKAKEFTNAFRKSKIISPEIYHRQITI
jgi:hypothetical protein